MSKVCAKFHNNWFFEDLTVLVVLISTAINDLLAVSFTLTDRQTKTTNLINSIVFFFYFIFSIHVMPFAAILLYLF